MTTPGQERVGGRVLSAENEWLDDDRLQEFLVRKFLRHQGYLPNLASPSTFNEKLLHKMLFDRRRILTIFADKLAVRDYVEHRLAGKHHLPAIYGVFARTNDLYRFTFPPRFAFKANHGSGWNYIHHGGQWSRVQLVQLSRQWLASSYGRRNGEWCYRDIEPRLFCEEYLGTDEAAPADYKFFCFSGKVRFIMVHFDRYSDRKCNIYDRDWTFLHFRYSHYPPKFAVPAPNNPERMISIAERLSEGIDFVRVDLYDLKDRVVFGELTNYPGGLESRFYPQHEWEAVAGSFWRLPV